MGQPSAVGSLSEATSRCVTSFSSVRLSERHPTCDNAIGNPDLYFNLIVGARDQKSLITDHAAAPREKNSDFATRLSRVQTCRHFLNERRPRRGFVQGACPRLIWPEFDSKSEKNYQFVPLIGIFDVRLGPKYQRRETSPALGTHDAQPKHTLHLRLPITVICDTHTTDLVVSS